MADRRFVNPKGGYFVEDARGRLRDAPRHNPDNLHIGESWYGGPLAKQGNPRASNDAMSGWFKGGNTQLNQSQVPTWKSPSTTPFGPHGFTGGGGGRMVVPWTNTVTGQTWNAPSTGYLPPSGDWQQTGKWEGRTPVKSLSGPVDSPNTFNAGWKKGWGEIKDNWDSGRKGFEDWKRKQAGPDTMIPLAGGFDPGNRRPIYDKNGRLIQQRPILGDKQSHIPIPFMDYVGSQTASHGYSTDNFYNPNDDQYYNDYEDDYHDNPMRDDYFVQDPFSDIWGNQGGPLYFG